MTADAAREKLASIMRTFPHHEQGFPRWALADDDPKATWVIARGSAGRLLLALVAALKEAEAENERLMERLRLSYPKTPVDCLLSDLSMAMLAFHEQDAESLRQEIEAALREACSALEGEPS